MKKIFIITLLFVTSTFATQLEILSWRRINPFDDRNTSAEICVKLTPAPALATLVQLTVDPKTRQEAYYNMWIDLRGSGCHIVSTFRGRIEASLLNQKISKSLK